MQERFTVFLVAGCLGVVGCGGADQAGQGMEAEADDVARTSQPVVGFEFYGAPEIGVVTEADSVNTMGNLYCTGTAIAPNVVLTVGSCNARFFFTIEPPLNVRRFTVRERWDSPSDNVSLLWLWEPVPWTRPVKEHGPVNATASVVGFGGNDCPVDQFGYTRNGGAGRKRVGFFTTRADGWIDDAIICPRDEGAPVIDFNGDGRIFGVVDHTTGFSRGRSLFTATNRPNLWNDLMFVIWVWQGQSNAGR